MRYNPFDKELEDIDEQELSKLIENEVDEGWYIEYKSQIPEKSTGKLNTLKIVKSIAAFTNTKGGWIFWGVECSVNTASSICGVNLENYSNLQDQLSRIISSNINPTPIYHFKEVTLASGNVVFIIKVDESPTPPYITGNGVIYQRENNESNPIKDRYIIEKLSEKTEAYVKSIEDFTHFGDYGETVGQSESNQSFLELYLFPRPFDSFEFKNFFSNEFFTSIALNFYDDINFEIEVDGETFSTPLNIGFNSIYTSLDSIIIRPITDKNIIYKGTTVELFRNGNLKLVIPLYDFSLKNVPKHFSDSEVIQYLLHKYSKNKWKYELNEELGLDSDELPIPEPETLISEVSDHIRLFDGIDIILLCYIIVSKYKATLKDSEFDLSSTVGLRARVTNAWRKFVFFDHEHYLQNIKYYNIPLSPKSEIEIPKFQKGYSYNISLEEDKAFRTIAQIILTGIGLPDMTTLDLNELLKKGVKRFKKDETTLE